MKLESLSALSDNELLAGLEATIGSTRKLLACLLAYLAEVEHRRLHLEAACSSMFEYCVRRLGMSDGEAFRRTTAARLVRRFPVLLDKIARGEIHLSAVVLLRDHLTDENHAELIDQACGKTKLQVQEMLAARVPKPDVPTAIHPLPEKGTASPQAPLAPVVAKDARQPAAPTEERRASTEPLSPGRYKVELTISAELKEKIARATDLMRHRNPSGDLVVVLERAVDLLIAQLEKERFGKTTKPRTSAAAKTESSSSGPTAPKAKGARSGYISSAVRREVYERDRGQCTFVDELGRRCSSGAFLELDHRLARALGGSDDAENIRLLCRFHNALHAQRTFGREHVERAIQLRQHKREQAAANAQSASGESAESPAHPSNGVASGSADAGRRTPLVVPGDVLEMAARALKKLGFREPEAVRALRVVQSQLAVSDMAPSIENVIREALRVLS
jgi:5-methylcytosine-specific restriction endonuclease McrA